MISGLDCGQEYYFKVAGQNSAGTGQFSSGVTGVTLSQGMHVYNVGVFFKASQLDVFCHWLYCTDMFNSN